jgi:cysteine desulfurase
VLAALGLDRRAAGASIRFGLGRGTTEADIDAAIAAVMEAVAELRAPL